MWTCLRDKLLCQSLAAALISLYGQNVWLKLWAKSEEIICAINESECVSAALYRDPSLTHKSSE